MAPRGDEQAICRLAKASLLKWTPLAHPGVARQLWAEEKYFLTTRGMCDCGTEIGALRRADQSLPPHDPDFSRELKKLKKKGWSDAKIDRWLSDSRADAQRKHAGALQRLTGPHPEVLRWIEFVSAALNEQRASWIGVLLHWYHRRLDSEAIPIERKWLALSEFTEDFLLHAAEDVLYCVSLTGKHP